ncbi:hypothetical protein AK34_1827 [Burkholderia dolosa AU0158]|nr:hypothetical protein AK34_1827 [Burkholderia dolosa AU0158]VWB76663.1 hypothetical protein BDO18943_03607 [Burkholderia dolosa]
MEPPITFLVVRQRAAPHDRHGAAGERDERAFALAGRFVLVDRAQHGTVAEAVGRQQDLRMREEMLARLRVEQCDDGVVCGDERMQRTQVRDGFRMRVEIAVDIGDARCLQFLDRAIYARPVLDQDRNRRAEEQLAFRGIRRSERVGRDGGKRGHGDTDGTLRPRAMRAKPDDGGGRRSGRHASAVFDVAATIRQMSACCSAHVAMRAFARVVFVVTRAMFSAADMRLARRRCTPWYERSETTD